MKFSSSAKEIPNRNNSVSNLISLTFFTPPISDSNHTYYLLPHAQENTMYQYFHIQKIPSRMRNRHFWVVSPGSAQLLGLPLS